MPADASHTMICHALYCTLHARSPHWSNHQRNCSRSWRYLQGRRAEGQEVKHFQPGSARCSQTSEWALGAFAEPTGTPAAGRQPRKQALRHQASIWFTTHGLQCCCCSCRSRAAAVHSAHSRCTGLQPSQLHHVAHRISQCIGSEHAHAHAQGTCKGKLHHPWPVFSLHCN